MCQMVMQHVSVRVCQMVKHNVLGKLLSNGVSCCVCAVCVICVHVVEKCQCVNMWCKCHHNVCQTCECCGNVNSVWCVDGGMCGV